tara:strand:+ start:1297 stop:1536 length:240 start_codon:yes stop_codon:yes gene_type:complete
MAKAKTTEETTTTPKLDVEKLNSSLAISELEQAIKDMEGQLTEYSNAEVRARELRTQATGALGVLKQLHAKATGETDAN